MIFRCSPRSIFPSCPSASGVRGKSIRSTILRCSMPRCRPRSCCPRERATPDLERVIGGPELQTTADLPLFGAPGADDQPLITKASPPRPPLAVRRATPEVIKPRSMQARAPMLDLGRADPGAASRSAPQVAPHPGEGPVGADGEVAGLFARLTAGAIDLIILAAIDLVVIYFTMQICGLDLADLKILPKGPLVAFLLVQNLGYLVVFTAGGQTLGKMAADIRVVSARSNSSLDLCSLDGANAGLARSRRSRRVGIPDGAVQPRSPGLARPLCGHPRRPGFRRECAEASAVKRRLCYH